MNSQDEAMFSENSHMPLYIYIEQELPVLQRQFPEFEKVRLLSKLVLRWEEMQPNQRATYEKQAHASYLRYKYAAQQSLDKIRMEINQIKPGRQSQTGGQEIKRKLQVQEEDDETHPQELAQNKQNRRHINQRKSKNSAQGLDLDLPETILSAKDFKVMVKSETLKQFAAQEGKSRQKLGSMKLALISQNDDQGKPRNKSINQRKAHLQRSRRMQSR